MLEKISTHLHRFIRSSYQGVKHDIPGNGGIECYNYLTMSQRIIDSGVFFLLSVLLIIPFSLHNISLPTHTTILEMCRTSASRGVNGARKLLLVVLCLIFGAEIGFKILNDDWIYLLNPCHVITTIQIYLLASQPSRTTMAVFRVHWHLLFGPLLASLFPVTNTRTNAMQVWSYWLQHVMITFIIPPYLVSVGGAYTCEALRDFTWALLTVSVFGGYMFAVLQGVGMLTLANLNNMLCPAITDPFYGPNYRWWAIFHQTALILTFGKIYYFLICRVSGWVWKDFDGCSRSINNSNNNNNDDDRDGCSKEKHT